MYQHINLFVSLWTGEEDRIRWAKMSSLPDSPRHRGIVLNFRLALTVTAGRLHSDASLAPVPRDRSITRTKQNVSQPHFALSPSNQGGRAISPWLHCPTLLPGHAPRRMNGTTRRRFAVSYALGWYPWCWTMTRMQKGPEIEIVVLLLPCAS